MNHHLMDFVNILAKIDFNDLPLIIERIQRAERIFVLGNGASNSMASHFVTDLIKNKGRQAFTISDAPLLTCLNNDYGGEDAYVQYFKTMALCEKDILIFISSSGNSQNLVHVCDLYPSLDSVPKVALTSFNKNNYLNTHCHYRIFVPAKTYGMAESAHAYLLHAILDGMEDKK